MKKLLVCGGTGFVGSHLHAAAGGSRDVTAFGRDHDVRDPDALLRAVRSAKPDEVIYLAAITTLRESFDDPRETFDVNFGGVLNLLLALRDNGFRGRMLFVSSSEVYGLLTETDLPVSERHHTRPRSPYAAAKIAAEALCYQWSQTDEFDVVVARPFNHIGPGQSERFAIAEFASQLARISLGLAEPVLHVGDVDTTRDFTDVRDVVSAYLGLLEHGRNGEIYNVCSGAEQSIRSLIMRMCELAGLQVALRNDPRRGRSADQRRVFGTNAKLIADTGWQQQYPIDRTLSDILDSSIAGLRGQA